MAGAIALAVALPDAASGYVVEPQLTLAAGVETRCYLPGEADWRDGDGRPIGATTATTRRRSASPHGCARGCG